MNRRNFLLGAGAAIVGLPLAAKAVQPEESWQSMFARLTAKFDRMPERTQRRFIKFLRSSDELETAVYEATGEPLLDEVRDAMSETADYLELRINGGRSVQ